MKLHNAHPGAAILASMTRAIWIVVFTLISSPLLSFAGPLPPGWLAGGFGRGVWVTNTGVEFDAGTWNVKTGPLRSAIVCQSLQDDLSVVLKLTDASGQANARVGIMMWSSLALTAGKAGLIMDPQGQKLYFTWDEATDRPQIYASFLQAEGIGFPIWLKLTRSGSYFAAYYSRDGQDWRSVGVPVKTFWAGKRPEIFAGIFGDGVCEQRVTNLKIARESVALPGRLPAGWSLAMQGLPAFVGDARFADGRWTLAGASANGRGGYHNVTVQQPVSPKVQLTTRVRTADLSDPRAGGGLLLNAHGVDAGIMAFPATAKLMFFTRQTETGRLLVNKTIPMPSALVGQAEMYLRIALVDARVAAFFGADTNDWTQVGDIVTVNEMAADVSGGMELSGGSGSRVVTAVSFDDYQSETITALPVKAPPVVAAAQPTPPPNATPQTAPTPAPRPYVPTSYPQPQRSSSSGFGGFLCIGGVVLAIVVIFLIKPFNRLVYLRNRALKGWSQIDVQLKRRHDLILNYVEAVKGYAKHERGTLEGVAQARSAAANATTVGDRAKAEAALNVTMRSLYAVVEANPDLKADKHFLSLQGNLRETEDKLADARNEYNEEVLTYNTQVQSFPTNLIALVFRFKQRDFFEVKEAEQRDTPKAAI